MTARLILSLTIVTVLAFGTILPQDFSTRSFSSFHFLSVVFSDSLNGWIRSNNAILSTNDGGMTFQINPISDLASDPSSGIRFTSISSPSSNIVWLIASNTNNNFVILTKDRGEHWDTVFIRASGFISNPRFNQIIATDSLNAWIQGSASPLCTCPRPFEKTTDGGKTWEFGGTYFFSHTEFITDMEVKHSFVSVLNSGKIFHHSKDNGKNWQADTLSDSSVYSDIAFADTVHGWIAGKEGRLLHTINTGDIWNAQQVNTDQDIITAYAVDSVNVWAIGSNRTVFHTTSGGLVWDSILTANVPLHSLIFSDNNHGWIVGDSGVVIRVVYGSITAASDMVITTPLFTLTQNYPNPFNPTTLITFALPEPSDVILTVHDYLGREVTTVVNRYMTAGTHSVSFDSKGLSSGVYFYRIRAGGNSAIKKMIVIK